MGEEIEETDAPVATTLDEVREMTARTEDDDSSEVSADEALLALADCVAVLSAESKVRSAASVTMDEIRNRAVYELNREKLSETIDDETNDTLPYLETTGSVLDKIIAIEDNVIGAVNSIVNNAETWTTDPEEDE